MAETYALRMMFQKTIDHAAEKIAREFQASGAALLRVDAHAYVHRLEAQAVMTRETVEDAALLIALALGTLGLCAIAAACVLAGRSDG